MRSRGTERTKAGPLPITSTRKGPTCYIGAAAGWSIKNFVCTARRYRTVQIQVGKRTVTAEDPLPPDLRDTLALTNRGAH